MGGEEARNKERSQRREGLRNVRKQRSTEQSTEHRLLFSQDEGQRSLQECCEHVDSDLSG